MDCLKASIFGNLINIHSTNTTEDEYKLNIFNYLENLKYQKDFNRLKEISSKLHEIESKN